MGVCELCGKERRMFKAIIEGTQLTVCKGCAKMGRIIQAPQPPKPKKTASKEEETAEVLVSDYGNKIRKARENSGLTQEDFAKKLNEKASIIQKTETGSFKPTIEKAKKWQRILGRKLVEEETQTEQKTVKGKGTALTIGDIIKVR